MTMTLQNFEEFRNFIVEVFDNATFDYPGVITVRFERGFILATPGWDDEPDGLLPISVCDAEGTPITEFQQGVHVQWTGNYDEDLTIWHAIVWGHAEAAGIV